MRRGAPSLRFCGWRLGAAAAEAASASETSEKTATMVTSVGRSSRKRYEGREEWNGKRERGNLEFCDCLMTLWSWGEQGARKL